MPEKEPNNGNQSNDNEFRSLRALKESICLILRQWQLDDTNDLAQISAI